MQMNQSDSPAKVGSSEGLGAWQPIETAPRDGSMVLVNDTTPGFTPWVAASYLDGEEWSGWLYDDATAQDCNPRGPNPTHWFPVPALPRHALDDAWPESPPHGATDIASLIGNPQDLIVRLLCSARDLELDEEIRLLCGESAVEIDRLVCRLERGA